MKQICRFALAYLALVLQMSAAPEVTVAGCRPDFFVLALVAIVFCVEGTPLLVWAAAVGFLSDCISPYPLGIGVVAFTMSAAILQRFGGERGAASAVTVVAVTSLAAFAIRFAVVTAHFWMDGKPVDPVSLMPTVAGSATYTAVLGAVAVAAVRLPVRRLRGTSSEKNGVVNRWKMLTE